MQSKLLNNRIGLGIPFTELISTPLPFQISCKDSQYRDAFPDVFVLESCEYSNSLDHWLDHLPLNSTSEQSVVQLDGSWQNVVKRVCQLTVMNNEHDASSLPRLRPDFTAFYHGMLVMKGEAKVSQADLDTMSDELINKFHPHAYKIFPKESNSIPAIMSSTDAIDLYAITYTDGIFSLQAIRRYDVAALRGRVDFCKDLIHICRWIMSQVQPKEKMHLIPTLRRETRNHHHITLLKTGLFKEFNKYKLPSNDTLNIIRDIYSRKLPNVEYGTVYCQSLTIARLGSRLRDVLRSPSVNKEQLLKQVRAGIDQLHSIGFAHCDICVDNVFVDDARDGGNAFIGDLEYARRLTDRAPQDLKRSYSSANTAEELDWVQYDKLIDDCAGL